jgi:RNA polymerase sigma-70 factor, ECF subfamily
LTRFETLIDQHHDEIYRYLWRLLAGAGRLLDARDVAQDVAQEVFMRAYRAFDRLPPGSNTRAWLYRIATNCAMTALKRDRRHASRTTPLPDDESGPALADNSPLPAQHAATAETLQTVRQAIAALPPRQQSALVMRYLQELDYPAIAGALGCSEDSARANVYQALKRLRRELAAERE